MIVSISKSPKITANTIIAANAPSIVADIAAPINNPSTRANAANNIIATITKHFLLGHFSSLLS